MTDMKFLGWRDVPLWCLFDQHGARRFNRAGYYTVGDVYDTHVAVIARSVDHVGPMRAAKFKKKIDEYAAWREAIEPKYDPEVTPTLVDATATIGALAIIGALFILTAWWLI